MSIFSNNLRFLRIQKGLNLDEFEFLGIKKGTMSNYELGKTEPKFDLLLKLSKFFGLSVDDFLSTNLEEEQCKENCNPSCNLNPILPSNIGKTDGTTNGNLDAQPNAQSNAQLTSFFMSNSGKTTGTNIIELPVVIEDESEMIAIPVVDISVAAGSGFYNPDQLSEIDCIRMPRSMVKGGQPYLCVRIKGESMVPTLQDGGYLIIRLLDRCEWADIRDGHVYVVSEVAGRAFVKRLKNRLAEHGFIVCMSDSADVQRYPNFNLMENELNTIWHAEWYISAKMPNIHATYYNKVSELEDKYDDLKLSFETELKLIRKEVRALGK